MPFELLQLLLFALLILPFIYFVSVVHEIGHMICARIAGLMVPACGMGIDRPFLMFECCGTRFYLCRDHPLAGFTFLFAPALHIKRGALVLALAGGVLGQLLLNGTFALGWKLAPGAWPIWLAAIALNTAVALPNLVPFSVSIGKIRLRTDGALIAKVLRDRSTTISALQVLQSIEGFRSLWESTGNFRSWQNYLTAAAWAWLELADNEKADACLKEASSLPVEPTVAYRALALVLRAQAICHLHPTEAAGLLARAEADFRDSENDFGLFLAHLAKVSMFQLEEGPQAAFQRIADLGKSPLVKRDRCRQADLAAARMRICCFHSDPAELETATTAYESLPRRLRLPEMDFQVYRALMEYRRRHDDTSAALAAATKLVDAIRRLDEGLAWGPSEQARLRDRLAPVVADARDCFLKGGSIDEAGRLDNIFPSAEERSRTAAEERRKSITRLLRIAWCFWLVNLVYGTGALALGFAGFKAEPIALLFILLAFSTILCGLLLFPFAVLRLTSDKVINYTRVVALVAIGLQLAMWVFWLTFTFLYFIDPRHHWHH